MNSKVTYIEQRNFLAQRNSGGRNPSRGVDGCSLRFSEKEWKL